MHIAHFTNTYKPNINGVVRSVSTFREALTDLGHQVFVFAQETRDYEDSEPFIFRYPGFEVPRFDYSIVMPVSQHVDWVLPALKLDVIHSNHAVLLGQVAVDRAEKLNLPVVFTFHTRHTTYSTYIPFSQAFIRGIIVDWLAKYIERCQHVITPSDSIRQMLVEYGGITQHITTIPTGIDLKPYQQADGRDVRQKYNLAMGRVLVSTFRHSMEKNWKVLFTAVAEVMRALDNVWLLQIGDGPLRFELEQFVRELGIEQRVIFAGLLPFEQVPHYLKAADLFCFASVAETQGLVSMEALAAGLPVVAVRASGTKDVVDDNQEGLLTENNSHALANAILDLLRDTELRSRLRAGALEKSKSFDSRLQADKMVHVYEQAIEDKRANRTVIIDRELLKETRTQLGISLANG